MDDLKDYGYNECDFQNWIWKNLSDEDKFKYLWSALFDLHSYRNTFHEFSWIDEQIFDTDNRNISAHYMIVKKWTAFHIVEMENGHGGRVLETLETFDEKKVIFSFTNYDLARLWEVNNTMEMFRTNVIDILLDLYVDVPVFIHK